MNLRKSLIVQCLLLLSTASEPIVCSVEDAFNCFMGTNLDILVIENLFFLKMIRQVFIKNYKNKFELD